MGNLKSKKAYFVHKRKTRKLQKDRTDEEDEETETFIVIPPKKLELSQHDLEEKHLLNENRFFPKETWVKILTKLSEQTDVENCTNASPYFRSLLVDKREMEVVLPKVFGILANRYSDENNKDESYKESNLASIPWRRSQNGVPHLMTGFWKCRLVCKAWNQIIEELHQNEDAGHFDMGRGFLRAKNSVLGNKWGTDGLNSEHKAQGFVDHFMLTHFDLRSGKSKKCPFVGRSVKMDAGFRVKNIHVYFRKMFDLLENWGTYIWYFEFSYHSGKLVGDFFELFKYLKQLINFMPNLKALGIHFDFKQYDHFLSEEEMEGLRQEITKNPFPKLTNLKTLSTDSVPAPLFNYLTFQNRKIQNLSISFQEFPKIDNVFSEYLPNLTQLSLAIPTKEDFGRFERSTFHLKLKKLQFIYYDHKLTYCEMCESGYKCYASAPFVRWSRVFDALENKFEVSSITDLYLQLPTPYTVAEKRSVVEDSLKCRLNFLNIERIAIKQVAIFSLDILLRLKTSLREISLFGDYKKFGRNKSGIQEMQVIQFVGFEDQMQNSNISTIFPQLKTLIVTDMRKKVRYDMNLNE